MKNKLFFNICILSCFALSSVAQDWNLGVKGGINVSKIHVKQGVSASSIVGFHFGGYAETHIYDDLLVQPEVLVSFQGYENNVSENISLVYFQVPILVKYFLVESLSVHAGPQFGFLIDAKDEREDFLKNTEISAAIGASYVINEEINVGIRYNLGLTDILDVDETPSEWRNRVFQVFVSYKLNR